MQSTSLLCKPIGTFYCAQKKRYALPKQPGLSLENTGIIQLHPHQNFEQALEDLSGFSRIWVIFWFHQNTHWKPKVLPPSAPSKRGVFATRSPYRPNPIGLSCLEITEIKGLEIHVSNHDLLDETPILDIKPYIEYADSWQGTRQGWLEKSIQKTFEIKWSPLAQEQINYLNMQNEISFRLKTNPFPSPNNRITLQEDQSFLLAYKTWRIQFLIHDLTIEILKIFSGYDIETLRGLRPSQWDDVEIHQAFSALFSNTPYEGI